MGNKVLELEPVSIEDESGSTLWKKDERSDSDAYDALMPQQQQQQRRVDTDVGGGSGARSERDRKQDLIEQIRQPTISVNDYAGVSPIPSENVDKTLRNPKFEFFRVDSGMNINVPRGKIKELRFSIVLYGDGKKTKNVFAISGFPNDKIKNIKHS